MTQFEKAIDFMNFVKGFHHTFGKYFKSLHNESKNEKIKLILEYLHEHEAKMEKSIDEYEEGISKKVEETWFQFIDKHKAPECMKNLRIDSDLNVDDLIEISVKLDDCLIELYKSLAEASESTEVREVFESLASLETHEKRKTVRQILRTDQML